MILPPWITPVPMKSNDHLLQQKFYIQIVLTMNTCTRDWISIYLHLGKSDSFKTFLLQHQHKVKPLIFSHNLLILNIIQVIHEIIIFQIKLHDATQNQNLRSVYRYSNKI